QHVAVHAVVVIEEAVADEDSGLGKVRPQGGHDGPGLRLRRGLRGYDAAQCDQRDHNQSKHPRHIHSPLPGLILGTLARASGFVTRFDYPGVTPSAQFCCSKTKSYLPKQVKPEPPVANIPAAT